MPQFLELVKRNRKLILIYLFFPIGGIILYFSDIRNKKLHYIGGALCFLFLVGIAKSAKSPALNKQMDKKTNGNSMEDLEFKGFGADNYSNLENGLIAKNAGLTNIALKHLCDVKPGETDYHRAQAAARELNFQHCGKARHDLGIFYGGIDEHVNKALRIVAKDIYGEQLLGWSFVTFKVLDSKNQEWIFSLSFSRLEATTTISLSEPCMRDKTCDHSGLTNRYLSQEELEAYYSIYSCPLGGWLGRLNCDGPGRELTGGPGRRSRHYKKFDKQTGARK